MKTHLEKLKPALFAIFGYGALGSVLVIGDQIRRIYNKINKATSCDVLSIDRNQPTYIYIEDPFIQEEISAGISINKERLKLTRFHKWLYDKIEESFMFRNWYSYKRNLPWRYLRLAQDENQTYRLRAVRSLASMKSLADADYQQLAQACDLRTAVGLARTKGNEKFLLDPPYYKTKPDKRAIIRRFHEFFKALDVQSRHPCLQYFVSKVIVDVSDLDNKVFDEDDWRFSFESNDFIPMCLEALLHHSWNDANARQIINLGGLPLLVEVYKFLKENEPKHTDSLIVLSKILSNISVCTDCAKTFFMSGWLKILTVMAKHKDIRISAPAQRALANFDEDDAHEGNLKYSARIYPLHPNQRTLAQPKLDVVFIHGLLGGIFITWRQRDYGHCSHKSPLELLAIVGKFFHYTISNRFTFASHLSAPKKVPSFPIPEPGLTGSDDDKDRMVYQTIRPLDQDFFVDVSDLNNWEKVANSYEFVLSDIPVDSNSNCYGPFYGHSKERDCSHEGFTKCWPKDWLADDCPDIRLIGVNYETNISKWTPLCPISPSSGTLKDRSQYLLNILCEAGVGKRPIIWIGHSMGGLLVKGVLNLSRNSLKPEERSLLEQTKGIVFYSTPHKGSHLAALNTTSQMIVWPSVEVQELRENSPGLLKLHKQFLEIIKENPIKVISFAERQSTYVTSLKFEIRFVDSESADPDVGEHYGIPLDHLSICKPSGRQSFLYQKVKKLVNEIISEIDSKKKNTKMK